MPVRSDCMSYHLWCSDLQLSHVSPRCRLRPVTEEAHCDAGGWRQWNVSASAVGPACGWFLLPYNRRHSNDDTHLEKFRAVIRFLCVHKQLCGRKGRKRQRVVKSAAYHLLVTCTPPHVGARLLVWHPPPFRKKAVLCGAVTSTLSNSSCPDTERRVNLCVSNML